MSQSPCDSNGDETASFEVFPYDIDRLKDLLCRKSLATPILINRKSHINYFKNYFEALVAKTIVVENEYVDRDYLDDFAGYYVRCFKEYRRLCSRLHFFDQRIDNAQFDEMLRNGGNSEIIDKLKNAYLGFVVVKPLPQTVIGRTCLKTYADDGGRRHFPITRDYSCNLFGLDLSVDTLAFQEQDNVVAACATSALWSIFQGTGRQFQHSIPSPVKITRTAASNILSESRAIPSQGLTSHQLAHAIREVGLEPLKENARNPLIFKTTLYSYLRGGIPIFLGLDLWDISEDGHVLFGKHGVAITGYSLGEDEPSSINGVFLKALRIDKIYVHDDQIGPFARMVFDDVKIKNPKISGDNSEMSSLSTSWLGKSGREGSVRAVPDFIIMPLYHKIRIPFSAVLQRIISFDRILNSLSALTEGIAPLQWDIFLTTVSDLKSDILTSEHVPGEDYRKKLLLTRMSRFIWRAIADHDGDPVIEVVFDATDIRQGAIMICAIEYDMVVSGAIRTLMEIPDFEAIISNQLCWTIFDWFKGRPMPV
jgi:hypothetical protein